MAYMTVVTFHEENSLAIRTFALPPRVPCADLEARLGTVARYGKEPAL